MTIGEFIHKRRIELGLTLEDIGNATGVGKSTVKKWETGSISNMRRDKIDALAKILKVNPTLFINNNIDEINTLKGLEKYITQQINDKSANWAKAMPVYKKIELDNTILGYHCIECTGYTRINDNNDFENYICLLVPDEGLEPRFTTSSIALIKKTKDLENEKYYYIVSKNNNQCMIRKISIKDVIILQPDNPSMNLQFIKKEDIVIIGKVIAIQKTEKL